jgi:hypothetical protein
MTVDERKLSPSKPDSHWLDCPVGCAAAASMEGVSLGIVAGQEPFPRKRAFRHG